MKKIKFLALAALTALSLVFAGCDTAASLDDDTTTPSSTTEITDNGSAEEGTSTPTTPTAEETEEPVITQTITFIKNADDATITTSTQTVNSGTATALTSASTLGLVYDGWTFYGWNTAADGTGTAYADGASITTTEDITLYARWFEGLPLTLEAINSGKIEIANVWTTLKYSKNGSKLAAYENAITVATGDKVCFFATESENSAQASMKINCNADCYLYGNVMCLVTFNEETETWDRSSTTLSQARTFRNLFYGNSHIKNHSEKVIELPATTLITSCYSYMFKGCTNLTRAPALPATTLANYCYTHMFEGCTSLTTAPELPANTLISNCYSYMFDGCTSLTTAPELPANKLVNYCYSNMFAGCSKLNYIKCLATDINADICLMDWVKNVAATGTFVKASNMSGWTEGADGIPTDWTVENAE
ncbi:MAG: InlB B-repeat-containing protein [Treponema sp.]|nr:InlB B-repeat-containing protein [Treponema sp.]